MIFKLKSFYKSLKEHGTPWSYVLPMFIYSVWTPAIAWFYGNNIVQMASASWTSHGEILASLSHSLLALVISQSLTAFLWAFIIDKFSPGQKTKDALLLFCSFASALTQLALLFSSGTSTIILLALVGSLTSFCLVYLLGSLQKNVAPLMWPLTLLLPWLLSYLLMWLLRIAPTGLISQIPVQVKLLVIFSLIPILALSAIYLRKKERYKPAVAIETERAYSPDIPPVVYSEHNALKLLGVAFCTCIMLGLMNAITHMPWFSYQPTMEHTRSIAILGLLIVAFMWFADKAEYIPPLCMITIIISMISMVMSIFFPVRFLMYAGVAFLHLSIGVFNMGIALEMLAFSRRTSYPLSTLLLGFALTELFRQLGFFFALILVKIGEPLLFLVSSILGATAIYGVISLFISSSAEPQGRPKPITSRKASKHTLQNITQMYVTDVNLPAIYEANQQPIGREQLGDWARRLGFSQSEVKLMDLLMQGLSRDEIAQELNLPLGEVYFMVGSLMEKTGILKLPDGAPLPNTFL